MPEPWHDKRRLYELYHRFGMDMEEIGELLGCTGATIGNWMDKHGVPKTRPHDYPAWLKWQYRVKGREQTEIAEISGTHQTTISDRLREYGIGTRHSGDYMPPSFYFSQDGYLTCRARHGGGRSAFRVHRLIAVAEHGFGAVSGREVHHKNGMKADNRHNNLEVMDASEHVKEHHRRGDLG